MLLLYFVSTVPDCIDECLVVVDDDYEMDTIKADVSDFIPAPALESEIDLHTFSGLPPTGRIYTG